MSVKTEQKPAMTIVGLNIRTKPLSPEIPALWPQFVARIPEIENPAEPNVAYGVMRPQPDALLYCCFRTRRCGPDGLQLHSEGDPPNGGSARRGAEDGEG